MLITTRKEFIFVAKQFEGLAFNCNVTKDVLNALISNKNYYITVLELGLNTVKINVMQEV